MGGNGGGGEWKFHKIKRKVLFENNDITFPLNSPLIQTRNTVIYIFKIRIAT